MAGTSLPQIDYTARDYTAIKEALVAHVQNHFPNDWNDFTESNLGMAILELIAYVGDQFHLYLDSAANEAFLPTARQRQNAINLAALIGYIPRTTAAASVLLQATLEIAQAEDTIINAYTTFIDSNGTTWEFLNDIEIPAGRIDTSGIAVVAEVLGAADGSTNIFAFITDNDNITPGTAVLSATILGVVYNLTFNTDGYLTLPFGGVGIIDHETGQMTLTFDDDNPPDAATNVTISYEYDQNITAYQGETHFQQFSSDGSIDQSFVITQTPVLFSPLVEDEEIFPNPNRFEVWIGDPGTPFGNATGTMWRRVENLVQAAGDEEVYHIKLDDQDRVVVEFGDNIAGLIPPSGSTITIIYRIGGGLRGNINIGAIDSSVTGQAGLLGVTVSIVNIDRGSGGAERESLEEIRVNAPASVRANDTATTEQDFQDLSAAFSRSGLGAVARAKPRLEPPLEVITKTVHSSEVLAQVPDPSPSEYFVLLPATPALVDTIAVSYVIGGIPITVSANDLGSGLADLSGDASIDQASTRLRYDQQDFFNTSISGFVGNGILIAFGPGILTGFPVLPSSVTVRYTIGTTEFIGYDDGAGTIDGPHISSGSITYETGSVSLTFDSAIASGFAITFDYQSCAHLVFNTAPDIGTEITISMESGPSAKVFPTNNIQVFTWGLDGEGNFVPPGAGLRDQLKAYLDLRRVIGTSVEVLPGRNVAIDLYLTVAFDPAIDQDSTTNRIVEALEDYFASTVNVTPGEDLVLAGVYDAIYPLFGVSSVIIQDVGVKVPIGVGTGQKVIYKDDPLTPASHITSGKLPAVPGAGQVKVYLDDSLVGSGDATDPVSAISGSGVAVGSFFNIDTGDFELKMSPAPGINEIIYLSFLLDEQSSELGIGIWNVSIAEWELAVLGQVFINDVKVR